MKVVNFIKVLLTLKKLIFYLLLSFFYYHFSTMKRKKKVDFDTEFSLLKKVVNDAKTKKIFFDDDFTIKIFFI